MMNKYNIPDDKHDAEIHLKAMKEIILELFEKYECNGIAASIVGVMHNELLEEINKLLSEY